MSDPIPLNNTYAPQQKSWFETNQKSFCIATKIFGFIVLMVSIGMLISEAGSYSNISSRSFSSEIYDTWRLKYSLSCIPFMTGMLGIFFGPALMVIGSMTQPNNNPEKVEKMTQIQADKNQVRQWKNLAIIIGFAIALIGLGLFLGCLSHLKSQSLDDLKKAIEEGIKHGKDPMGWAQFKIEYLNPTITKLTVMATVGVITAIAGGAIVVLGGGGAYLKEKWNSWFKEDHAHSKSDSEL